MTGRTLLGAAFLLALAGPVSAVAQYRVEAIAGRPWGVGRIEVRLPPGMLPEPLGLDGLAASERSGRVLYPAIERREMPKVVTDLLGRSQRPLGRLLGEILDRPPTAVIYFLFQGDRPLEITVHSRRQDTLRVVPQANAQAHGQAMQMWWRHFTARPGLFGPKDDYPPVVRNYLESMLARRLGFALPDEQAGDSWQDEFQQQLGLSLVSEKVKIDAERDRMLGLARLDGTANRPLPPPILTPELIYPQLAGGVQVEPIAMHVPAECLYIRFGSFANFLWFQDTLKKWGGDAQNLLSLRGLDHEMSQRMEEQLVLKQTALARLFGGTIITDVAVVATDTFFQDGAAYGLLFHARNNLLLANDFNGQRAERVERGDSATEKKVTIAGREVSLLSSPDGRVRSYYAIDGDFHLVTRCETLVRRFLETGTGQTAPLGAMGGFRYARAEMPLERDDTVFVYMSEPFFDNLVSPRYRIETIRRMHALADIELVQLAKLAAAAEGVPGGTIKELVAGGFLPAEFGTRPDGSRAVIGDGGVYDSRRGHRGSFLPVSDVEVTGVSPAEADAFAQFTEFYHDNWANLDPVVIGIRRWPHPQNREKVVVDLRMTPFSKQNFQRMQQVLGEPDTRCLAPVRGDIASFEVILKQQRIFGGLQDVGNSIVSMQDELRDIGGSIISTVAGPWYGRIVRDFLVGYLGTDGPLGPLQWLNLGMASGHDAAGFTPSPVGGWRRVYPPYTLFSFQHEILAAVAPQLRYAEADRPAQFRLLIGDVANARITPTLNNLVYGRTCDTSRGNLRLMHALRQQLHVPVEDCKEAAELILDAKLICPLGGEYVVETMPGGATQWTSTALGGIPRGGPFGTPAPAGFQAPPLSWFRGLEVDALITPTALSAHAEVIMQMPQGRISP